ncbi:zinc knuckle CX2CX4HX4C containing protein [Tanacetum coccineum]
MVNKTILVTVSAANFHSVKVDKVCDGVDILIPRRVVKNFESHTGLESVLEGGPWMIKNNPVILKEWKMNTSLLKEELNRVPIWVKFHEGDDFSKETICVEYEWKPPRCDKWLPTRFQPKSHNGGTTGGGNRGTSSSKPSSSNNNDDTFINKKDTMKDKHKESDVVDKGIMKMSNITSPNPFDVLGSDEDEEEEVENIFDESANLNLHNTRASTPADGVLDV